MPTITGQTRLPGGTTPLAGTWFARIRTNVGAAVDDDGTIRGGIEAVTDIGDGATMTLPAGSYEFRFESLTNNPSTGRPDQYGWYAYEVTEDTNWGVVIETPYDVPVTPSDVTRAEAARDAAEQFALAAANGETSDAGVANQLNTGSATDAAFRARVDRLAIDVGNFPTVQAAIDYAPNGARLRFRDGVTYHQPSSSYKPSPGKDRIHVDAMGATFTSGDPGSTDGWGKPVFDLLDVDGWVIDIGLAQYTGTRGTVAGPGVNGRGASINATGCVVWTNGDDHDLRYVKSVDFPTAVNFPSWDTAVAAASGPAAGALGRIGQNNRVRTLRVSGADFGLLWTGQNNFVVDDLYAENAVDTSGGINPTHAYYCTATVGCRSGFVQIKSARAKNILFGHAFQLKNCDKVQLGLHLATNCQGLINAIDCDDISWDQMEGTDVVGIPNLADVTVQSLENPRGRSRRVRMGRTTIHQKAGHMSTAVTCIAHDVESRDLSIVANHPAGYGPKPETQWRGTSGKIESPLMVSVGEVHNEFVQIGTDEEAATGWRVLDPVGKNVRALMRVRPSSKASIRYDPAATTVSGGGPTIVGAAADYYVIGNVPTQGVAAATGTTTLEGTVKDIAGASVTLNPAVPGKLTVTATVDVSPGGSDLLVFSLLVDGASRPETANWQGNLPRVPVTQSWTVPLAAGERVVKLQGVRSSGTSAPTVFGTHTRLTYSFMPGAA